MCVLSALLAEGPGVLVCVGPRLPGPGPRLRQVVTCILCQEEEEVRADGRAMVLAAFVQRSTVLSKDRSRSPPDPGRGAGPHRGAGASEGRAAPPPTQLEGRGLRV